MYALVTHHYWNRPGGGELVCASFAKVFEHLGFEPVLASTIKIDINITKYPEWFGIDLSKYPQIHLGIEPKAFGLYLRLLANRAVVKAIRRYAPKVMYIDIPTYKYAVDTIKKYSVKLIEYIHFPLETWFRKGIEDLSPSRDPYIVERYGRFPMNIYFKIFVKLLPLVLRENPFTIADLVLTNSKWTADLVKRIHGEEPYVLNPPLPPRTGLIENVAPFDARDDVVVMVGRFSEEKRYHWVIRGVFPKLRKVFSGVKLIVFGATGTKTAKAYYSKLIELARSLGFRVSTQLGVDVDIYLVENASRDLINEVMDRAKVFLHATINEHWGIAVAEAMARGLPIVVHRSGGTWSDLARVRSLRARLHNK